MLSTKTLRGLMTRQIVSLNDAAPISIPGLRYFAAASNQMALIKQLREQTGAPIADVKSALQQADWDLEKATQELRKKGLAAASKKASRHAAEGLVGLATNPCVGAIVEINSETDFVARNDQFKELVSRAAAALLNNPTASTSLSYEVESAALQSAKVESGAALADAVAEVAGTVRENIKLRRGFLFAVHSGSSGTIGSYLHGSVGTGLGRIASLVLLQHSKELSGDAAQKVKEVANKIAMHVVGAVPKYLDRSAVPAEALDAERAVLMEQAARSGKPQKIVEKMVEGRLSKFYEEMCLVEQPFIMDDKKKVKDVVASTGKEVGVDDLTLAGYVRVQVGEGLEEEEKKDFAAEVAETVRATSS